MATSGPGPPDRVLRFLPAVVGRLLREHAGPGSTTTFPAAVLSADISGFTALADQLHVPGAGGPEELRRRLNQVIAPTVAALTARGGDVLGFAGDSVLAVFTGDSSNNTPSDPESGRPIDAARTAAGAAIEAARAVGLGVRAGIAAGPVTVAVLGDERRVHAAFLGSTVLGAIEAQRGTAVGCWAAGPTDDQAGPSDRMVVSPWSAAAFLPPGRADQVRGGRSLLLAEQRSVTSLFAALPAVFGRADRVADLQRDVVAALAIVRAHGGDLRQVEIAPGGPVLVCAFGATSSAVDDEKSAVACARDLLAVGAARAAGIAAGPVFCGVLGTAVRADLVVAGASVNLAARLLAAATDGEVLVDDATAAAISASTVRPATGSVPGVLATDVPRELSLRGLPGTIRAWSVGDPSTDLGGVAPIRELVGRDTELALLLDAADRLASSHRTPAARALGENTGHPASVYVVRGPAGIGKSALAAAVVRARVDHSGLSVRFSVRENGWSVWTPALRTMLDLRDHGSMTPDAIDSALLRVGIGQLDGQAGLLSPIIPVEGQNNRFTRSFDGRARDELLASLLGQIISGFARLHRTVVVIEDAHLAGPELDAVLRVVGGVDCPALVLVLDRVDPGAPPPPRPGHVLELSGLDVHAARRLARAHTPSSDDADTTLERVVVFADGNPLHLEQLALHLADESSETVVDDDSRGDDLTLSDDGTTRGLPSSLVRVLRARLDRLPSYARDVTTVASLLGDDVSGDLLVAAFPALGTDAEVNAELSRLSELAVLVASAPGRYRFRHDAVRAVAYAGVGRAARQDLHGAVGRHLARRARKYETDLRDVELIAWHFEHSRDTQAQRQWLRRAGDGARAAWSLTAARRWYAALIPILDGPTQTEVRLALAEVRFMTGEWVDARAGYEEVLRRSAAGTEEHTAALHGLGVLAIRTSSIPVAIDRLGRAVDAWSALGRPDRELAALDRLAFAHHVAGSPGPALATAARLLRLADIIGDPGARAEALETAALAAWTAGDLRTAVDRLGAALEVARATGNLRCVVHALSDLAGVRLELGDDGAALAHLAEADTVAERIGYRRAQVSLRANRGEVLRRRGDLESARAQLVVALEGVLVLGDTMVATSVTGNLGLVEAALGHDAAARHILDAAVRTAEAAGVDSARHEFATALASITPAAPPIAERAIDEEVADLLNRLDGLIASVDRAL